MAEEEEVTTAVERTLEITPTWAVATVCFFLILVSILIEKSLFRLGKYFTKKRRKSLIRVLDKIKSELMLLGFISLLLNFSERPIAKTCIPKSAGETFLPCSDYTTETNAEEETKCAEQGKVSLLSRGGVQELQYLIFMLGGFHIFSCILTFSLGMAKMRRWESWEAETRSLEYQFSNDPRRFQLTHQTSFGKRHLKYWSDHRVLRWPACFLRQFYQSVYKVDYFILRHGFITVLHATNPLIIYNYYFWLPFFPLVMLLVVGTKLQGIITKMCLDSHEKSQVVRGTLLVRPSDHFFWFGWPKLLLYLIHFILFQNSFQLAFFAWTWYKFGFRSCFHKETEDIVIRLAMGVVVQVLCGYVTLPLYALVTQMGTSMRKDVFTEGVVNGLKRWRVKAKRNVALRNTNNYSLDTSLENSLVFTSPSFNTLEATLSVESGSPSGAEYVSVGVEDEEKGIVGGRSQPEPEEKPKIMGGSFHGFDVVQGK
ncbi:hypothetical protein FH972_000537 [Carpinus fangiana]|uniref:MLO-like protein n=1 Tax=Carpinus fangiana TaxID=176857 RepID=A0A5N6Q949_9ROSI|nr:hypothetical protein FH972_000537 [Carpinus fangiana]